MTKRAEELADGIYLATTSRYGIEHPCLSIYDDIKQALIQYGEEERQKAITETIERCSKVVDDITKDAYQVHVHKIVEAIRALNDKEK